MDETHPGGPTEADLLAANEAMGEALSEIAEAAGLPYGSPAAATLEAVKGLQARALRLPALRSGLRWALEGKADGLTLGNPVDHELLDALRQRLAAVDRVRALCAGVMTEGVGGGLTSADTLWPSDVLAALDDSSSPTATKGRHRGRHL